MKLSKLSRIPFSVLFLSALAACSGPFLLLPGSALVGPEASIETAKISGESALIELETRPADPYSVNLNAFFIGGAAYIDPAEDRQWYQYLVEDANVRVKFAGDGTVYTAVAVRETDPGVVDQFEADRIVMRLDPR